MLLGCIGDDFTGSSDLANTLARQGMRTTLFAGRPTGPAAPDVEAGVVALKSRSVPAAEAIRLSLEALDWLRAQGCRQFLFKYCSTFDSTDEGNIGPVAEALAEALDASAGPIVFCPAFPAAGRTVVHGHLFVGDRLLSESGMEHHPLTPMTDPDIRRVLGRQAKRAVGHADYATVALGAEALRRRLDSEAGTGRPLVVVDALSDADLATIGAAADGLPLITGGSGVAMGLPANFRRAGLIGRTAAAWRGETGPAVALCGSCSVMSRRQIAAHMASAPAFEVDADAVISGALTPGAVADWALVQTGLPLIYSSAEPGTVAAVQARHGRERAAAALEGFFAELARRLRAGGVRRLITAGGETSGAVVEGLDLTTMQIGPEIAPGVPAMRAGDDLVVALKSGNFGAEDFFARAADVLATRIAPEGA
ncbi:MAG: 3-oxo-tetronate kinase [Rubrimonas sp.]